MSNGLSKADIKTKELAKQLEQIKTMKNKKYSSGDDDSSPELDRKALEKNIENNLKRWNKVKVR